MLAVAVVLLLASLATVVHLWRGAVADAATWQQSTRQLQQTVADSEAENARLRERMQQTQALLAKHAKERQAIARRADHLQARLTAAQDAADAAYQHCRALPLSDRLIKLLRNGAADHSDEH